MQQQRKSFRQHVANMLATAMQRAPTVPLRQPERGATESLADYHQRRRDSQAAVKALQNLGPSAPSSRYRVQVKFFGRRQDRRLRCRGYAIKGNAASPF